jgi:amyloid beta precursor protein binding protein 1
VRASARMNNAEGGEENYDEAAAAVLKSLNPFGLRSTLREVFEMDECKNLKPESNDFWIIASAINEFYQKYQVLPLPGSLPDMKAQSADYIALQNIYKTKAKKDVEEVTGIVRQIESQLGSRPSPVLEKDIEIFCRNAAHIKVVRGRNIPQLDDGDEHIFKAIRNNLSVIEGLPETLIPIFIASQILDAIVTDIQEGKQASGSIDDEGVWRNQIDRFVGILRREDPAAVDEDARQRIVDATQELRRTDGGELHNISALAGGLVAQEALKVITRQYVPLDNTCIFDGVQSRTEMYKL